MSKQISVLLSDEALEVIQDYMEQKACSRNKAINDTIVSLKDQIGKEPIEVRLGKANIKLGKDIIEKLDEVKAILTKGSEE